MEINFKNRENVINTKELPNLGKIWNGKQNKHFKEANTYY